MSYKRWSFIAILLFSIGLVTGLVAPPGITALASKDIAALKELSGFLAPFSFLTAILIFIKNTSALLFSFVFSPILCLIPILSLTANGWLLGLVSAKVIEEESLGFLLAGLLPHGIFELPALILGEAAALSLGTMVMVSLFKQETRNLLPSVFKQNLRYLVIALALLLPAAIIETYITPLLIT